ncbi:hypothetical protein [Burkholderia cenocepacia]|nr:hypothetical protein [Burkholderia cenocepacia]
MNVTRMIGAVFGVAMLTGGTLQLAGAALAWRTAGADAPKPIG